MGFLCSISKTLESIFVMGKLHCYFEAYVSFLRISSAMYFLAYSVWYRGTELFTEIIMKTSSCWIESFLTCGVACYWVQTEVATRKYIFEIIALPTYYSISAGLFLMLVCWWTQYCYAIAFFPCLSFRLGRHPLEAQKKNYV